jgi:hypothetical protein
MTRYWTERAVFGAKLILPVPEVIVVTSLSPIVVVDPERPDPNVIEKLFG